MTRHLLPLPAAGLAGAFCLLLAATTLGGASAARYEYTNLHRDVYLDLVGQSSPFASEAARSTLTAALQSYGPTFVTKFSVCIVEFTGGDTEVASMSTPSWKVYSSARQYPNANGDGYLQQIQWKSAEVIFVGDEDVSDDDVTRCTRRAFNIGKSAFVPFLLEEDAAVGGDGAFQSVEKAKIVPMTDFSPPPPPPPPTSGADAATTTAEDTEAETANDVLAESELVQDMEDEAAEEPAEELAQEEEEEEEEEEVANGELPLCPVKVKVDCRSSDGSKDCNDVPMPEDPDCKIKVVFSYKFTVQEEIRLQSAKRYRKGSYQGCDNFELCEVRDYLENYQDRYVRKGSEFDAWEEVCEDTRHDTLFEMRAQMETYYGSMEWVDCVISDEYEDKIWSRKETRGYLDLIKTNKVVSVSKEAKTMTPTEDPTGAPTANPTSVPTTSVPTSSPTSSPVASTRSPVASPTGETSAETLVEPEEFLCDQLSLSINCSTMDGVDCNDVALPDGTESDPCNVNIKYVYSAQNVGNTGSASFSKLTRSRTGADSEDIDFLPFFGEEGLVLGQAYTAGAASMTESTSVNFCQPQTQVTVLVAESETARGGSCNTAEEYLLMTPVEVPLDLSGEVDENANTEGTTQTEHSQGGFETVVDSSEVSKEGREEIVTVQVVSNDDVGASSMVIAQSIMVATSAASAVVSPLLIVSLGCALFLLASVV